LRFLILEDEPLIALDLQFIVEDSGHEVVGVVASLSAARAHLARYADSLDFALLDVDVQDGKSFAFASLLDDRTIPFAFVSGSRPSDLPPTLCKVPFIRKPFQGTVIKRCLATLHAADQA
jgi:response regulator of citrate/malate metabolism